MARGWGKRTGFCVALEAQHNLGSAIPPRRHVFCHVAGILLWVDGEASCKAEVADLQLTVGVHEQVAGFEIPVEHVGRVDVLQAAQNLVDEGLKVCIGEWLPRADDGCKVALHQLWEDQRSVSSHPLTLGSGKLAHGGSLNKSRSIHIPSYK